MLQIESPPREADGRRHDRGALHRAVPGERQFEPRDVAGHAGREIALGARPADDVAVAVEVHVRRRGEGGGLAEIDERLAPVGELDRHESAAAQAAGRGEHHAERVADGHRGVDRVAALLQDVDAGFGGEMLAGDDHAVARSDGRLRCGQRIRAAREDKEGAQQGAHGEGAQQGAHGQAPRRARRRNRACAKVITDPRRARRSRGRWPSRPAASRDRNPTLTGASTS